MENKELYVQREDFEYNGKTYKEYFIKGTVRGREVKIAIAPPDKETDRGGYAVLDLVFGEADKAEFVVEPFEIKDGVQPGPCCHNCRYVDLCPDAWKIKDLQSSQWSDEAAAIDGYHRDLCMYLSDKDTHDNGFAMVEYDNGARASHMECFVTSQTDRLYTIVGSLGQMEISLTERKIVVKPRWSKETATYVLPEDNSGHGGADTKLMDEFINVILHTTPNHASALHGMYSTAVAQAAEISRKEERLVRIEELFQ